jgi:hypothetical protein
MPYSPDQLEFLSVHMGVAVPPQLLEKKRGAGKVEEHGEGKPEESEEVGAKEGQVSLVALQQSRLAWDQARKQIQTDLKTLGASITAACQEDEEIEEGTVDVGVLQTILDGLDNRLIDKLDEALNASDLTKRAQLNQEAKTIAKEYMAFVNGNALMADIDDSGFASVAIRKSAVGALNLLASKL